LNVVIKHKYVKFLYAVVGTAKYEFIV